MAFDAGTIRTEADLDIAAFQRNMVVLQGAVNQVNKTMEGVKPAAPALDAAEVTRNANVIQTALSGLGKSLVGLPKGQVSLEIGNAQENVTGLTKALGGLGDQLGITKALGGVGSVLGAGTLVAAAGTATVALLQLGAQWKQFNLDLVRGSGATGQALTDLKADFNALFAGAVGVEGSDLAKALPIIRARLDETGAALRSTTQDIIAFGRVMGGDIGQNAQEVTRLFQAWKIATDDQHASLNFLVSVAQLTGENVHALTQELVQIAPVAKQFGLSFEETAALIAQFAGAGIEAGSIMRGLNKAASDAAKSGQEGRVVWEALLNVIANSPDDIEAARVAVEAFGARGGLAIKTGLRDGTLAMDEFIATAKELPGPLDTAAARGESSAKRLEAAMKGFQAAVGPVGAELLTFSQNTLAAAGDALNRYGKDIDAFIEGPLQKLAAALIGIGQGFDALAEKQRARDVGQPGTTAAASPTVAEQALQAQQAAADAAGISVEQLQQDILDLRAAYETLPVVTDEAAAATEKHTQSLDESRAIIEDTKGKVASLADQLAKLSDVGAIQALLDATKQTKDLDEAISSLTDTSLAAFLQAEKNMALAVGQATGDWSRWEAAVQGARQALDDQKAAEEAAKEAKRQANEELKQQQKIMQEVAAVAGDQYKKRLEELAKTLLPGLSAESAVLVQQLLLQGEAYQAVQVAAAAYGKSVEALGPIHDASQQQFEETRKKAEELAKAVDPEKLFRDELRDRSKSILDAVIGNLSAAEAAALRFQASSVGALDALSQKFGVLGGDAATFRAAMQGALSGSAEDMRAFTTAAENAVKFLETGAIPQVPAPPKDAVDAWADAYQKASQQLADASAKTSEALRQADATLQQETATIRATLDQARADYARSTEALNRQDEAARASFAQAALARSQALSATLAALSREAATAQADREKTVTAANATLGKSYQDFAQTATDAVVGFNKAGIAATDQWVQAQQAALSTLSSSLTAIRQQETQATLAFSRSMQDLTEKGLIGPQTQEAMNELAKARLRLQQDFGLQEAGLSTAESAARGAFGRATTAADAQLQKQAQANAEALRTVLEELEKKRKDAEEKQQQAIADADEKLRAKLDDIATKQGEAIRKAAKEAKDAQEAEDKRQLELEQKRKDLEQKLKEAEDKAALEQEKADKKHDGRVAEIRKDQDKAVAAFQQAMLEPTKDLTRAVQALQTMGVDMNTLMKAVLQRAGVEVAIDYKDLVIQETGVDFLKVAIQSAEKAMKAL